jgi:hypothetical protein
MEIQIYIDSSPCSEIDLEDIVEPALSDIRAWVEKKSVIKLLDSRIEGSVEDWRVGICMKLKSKFKLKDPLSFLYELSKKYKCEFVVAEYDSQADLAEAVCYFGFEEGEPDMFEIANYLGL